MCRHLAYLGPPIPLSRLLFEPPHALVHQSWAPKDMRGGGTINADGFGVGWYHSVAGLAERLPVTDLVTLDAPTDSALLWALVRDRLREGASPGKAVAETVVEGATAAPGSRLNVLLTDGDTVVATALGHALSMRHGAAHVLLSSEPLDDVTQWQPVPDGQLVTATRSTVDTAKLGAL